MRTIQNSEFNNSCEKKQFELASEFINENIDNFETTNNIDILDRVEQKNTCNKKSYIFLGFGLTSVVIASVIIWCNIHKIKE